ncbi:lamin tail domain-containing protein [Patescibacteria group bacterium]|nr:lamin tail domain-containing protein [Patescibacteria group bacterium]
MFFARKNFLFLILVGLLFVNSCVLAANSLDVVINEIAWMGTKTSANDEWIELYNNCGSAISIENWTIKASDDSPKINLKGIIPVNGFFLLERTNDDTIPGIFADQIYTGALENNGEELKLYDNSGNLIDFLNCSSGWFGGNNATNQTMERKNFQSLGSEPQNWQTSQSSGGTAKSKNSFVQTALPIETPKTEAKQEATPATTTTSTPTSTPVSSSTSTPTSTIAVATSSVGKQNNANPAFISYPSGIVINEILPAPEGADDTGEWIEIKNLNEQEIDLSGWKIQDTKGSINTYIFPKGTKINGKSFLVFSRTTTKITLNNSDDGLSFIQPNGNILDSVTYQKAPKNQSYNRLLSETKEQAKHSDWTWSSVLTPGLANIIPAPQSLEEKNIEQNKNAKTLNENSKFKPNKFIATAANQVPDLPKPLLIFLLVLVIAIISGIVIFLLKKRFQKQDEM